jgi:hypothetical protein
MLIPFGVLSAAAFAPSVVGDYELIESAILTSNESSVTFSNLGTYSSTYKHLQIRYVGRTNRSANDDTLALIVNGDTGNNYSRHGLTANGSSVSSDASTSRSNTLGIPTFGSTGTSNAFSAAVIDILDPYSTTKNTTLRGLGGLSGNVNAIFFRSGLYINTASISSVTIFSDTTNNLLAGSRFSIYGIKG